MKDKRFEVIARDPRFLPQKTKKSIKSATNDSRFNADALLSLDHASKQKVDKYGRPISTKGLLKKSKRPSKVESQEDDAEEVEEDFDFTVIRGETLLESSDEEDEEYDEQVAKELDEQAEQRSEEESDKEIYGDVTSRFAVVNMDWDNIKARDLFKVFAAFVPKGGVLHSVSIYKSEFGKERLELEATHGPPSNIFKSTENAPLFETSTAEDFDEDNLRKYQKERLRYFYAVVCCDSRQTAKSIYDNCDGTEFETTSNVFDLKFIPKDMKFEDEPEDVATEAPAVYQPAKFTTTALQHSKVELTWDQDDPDRVRVTKRKFTKDQLKDMDFQAYLASDSDENSDAEETIAKYKSLVQSADDSSDPFNKDKDVDMEITFTPGLSDAVAEKIQKLQDKTEESVFEQNRRKQKEKRKQKRLANEDNDSGEDADVGNAAKEELDLLMYDGLSTDRHFDMKNILKVEKESLKRKKKKHKLSNVESTQSDFKLDVADPRFAAVHESHVFAIDPTNPQYKSSSAMKQLLDESRKARSTKRQNPVGQVTQVSSQSTKGQLQSLVDSIKRRQDKGRK